MHTITGCGRADGLVRFFITLEPCSHLNGKHTIFGRLVSGEDVLEKIAKVEVDDNDRPLEPVLVSRCGELEKRKKPAAPATRPIVQSESTNRGRRRKDNDSDEEMRDSTSPERRTKGRTRRQSDNVVDEGLRGRPRQRSGSRSASSRPLSTPSEEDDSQATSPVSKHKRKRSPSPSRHHKTGKPSSSRHEARESDHERRRRRSLPNQYEDENRYRPSPRRDDYRKPRDDRYRPSRDRYRDDGRLGDEERLGSGAYDDAPVKFKGRGVMKYREPGRL